MHLTTNTSVSPNRFVPPLFQDASTISFDTAAQWPQQEMRHLRKLVAAAELLGVPRPALAENAESLTPELRQEFEHWITRLPLNRLCRERPEACEAFMEAVQSADEAYRRQADKSTTTRRFLQYALSVLDRNLNPSPEDIAVRERAHGLETHYLNQLAPRERHSFILAQRCADRSMDKAVTQGYGSKDFHAQHPEFWRYLTIIRHVRNMALDVIADKSTIDTPKVLPMGGNIVPIVTRHPTYRRTADQNDCARELRLHLEGNIQDKAVDQARAVDLMNGMVGKELIKPTIMDEMKMTAADTQNDFRSHLYGSEAARNTDHLKKISRLSPDMFVWPAFDQDVDEPEKLTGCMEALSCMMRKSKWDVIVESLKRHKVSPELLTRAEATRDYWTLGVQWWEKNLQFEAERRNQVIRSDKPIDASLVDVTQHPDYPRMTAGKIGRNEQANEERDALLALLAAEKNPRLEPLAKLVEIKGLGANGEFRISGAGPRGFLAPGPDGKLQIKPTMKRLLEERRWEMERLDGDVSRILIAEYAEGTWAVLHDTLDKLGLRLQLGPNHKPDGIPFTPLVEAANNVKGCFSETQLMLRHTQQHLMGDTNALQARVEDMIANSDFPKRAGQVGKTLAQAEIQQQHIELQKRYPKVKISTRVGTGGTVSRGGGPNGYRDAQAGLLHIPASGAPGEHPATVAVTVQGVDAGRRYLTEMAARASRAQLALRTLHAFDDPELLDETVKFAAELDFYVGGLHPRLGDDPTYETLLVGNKIVDTIGAYDVGGARSKNPAGGFKGPESERTIKVSRTYQSVGMIPWYNNLLDVPKDLLDRVAADAKNGKRFATWWVASLFHELAQADMALLKDVVERGGDPANPAHVKKMQMVGTLREAYDHACHWLRKEGFVLRHPSDILVAAPGPLLTQQAEGLGLHPDSDYETIENARRQQMLERRSIVELAAKDPATAFGPTKLAKDHTEFIAKLQATHRLYNSTDGEG